MKRKLSISLLVIAIISLSLTASPVFGGEGDVTVKPDGLEKAKQAQEKHTSKILAREGVEGTAASMAKGSQPWSSSLRKNGVQGLPSELNGVPVSVRVTGKFYALAAPSLDTEFSWTCDRTSCNFDASSTTGKGKRPTLGTSTAQMASVLTVPVSK